MARGFIRSANDGPFNILVLAQHDSLRFPVDVETAHLEAVKSIELLGLAKN